jgi:hypothetical protein
VAGIGQGKVEFINLAFGSNNVPADLASRDEEWERLDEHIFNQLCALLDEEIRKDQVREIEKFLSNTVVDIALLNRHLTLVIDAAVSKHADRIYDLYSRYLTKFISYFQPGDTFRYQNIAYVFEGEHLAPDRERALFARIKEDIQAFVLNFAKTRTLQFRPKLGVAELRSEIDHLRGMVAVANSEYREHDAAYVVNSSRMDSAAEFLRKRARAIWLVAADLDRHAPSTFILASGMSSGQFSTRQKLPKTFASSSLDPLVFVESLGGTYLHHAVNLGQTDIIKLFLDAYQKEECNPIWHRPTHTRRIVDKEGNTVFHRIAIMAGETAATQPDLNVLLEMLRAVVTIANKIERDEALRTSENRTFVDKKVNEGIEAALLERNKDRKTVAELFLSANKLQLLFFVRKYITLELVKDTIDAEPTPFERKVFVHLSAYEENLRALETIPHNRAALDERLPTFNDEAVPGDDFCTRLIQRRKALDSLWIALWAANQTKTDEILIAQIRACGLMHIGDGFFWGTELIKPLVHIATDYIRGRDDHAIVIDAGQIRLDVGARYKPATVSELDLSMSGLGKHKSDRSKTVALCSKLKEFGKTHSPTVVYLNDNGFYLNEGVTEGAAGVKRLATATAIEIVQSLPPSVTTLYLDGNGFERYNREELGELFKGLPKNIVKVSLDDMRLLLREEQLKRITWPKSYHTMVAGKTEFMAVAKVLLSDYTKDGSQFRLYLSLHFNRHFLVSIGNMLDPEEPSLRPDTQEKLLSALKAIDKAKATNPCGSLARRYTFLCHYADGRIPREGSFTPARITPEGSRSSASAPAPSRSAAGTGVGSAEGGVEMPSMRRR